MNGLKIRITALLQRKKFFYEPDFGILWHLSLHAPARPVRRGFSFIASVEVFGNRKELCKGMISVA